MRVCELTIVQIKWESVKMNNSLTQTWLEIGTITDWKLQTNDRRWNETQLQQRKTNCCQLQPLNIHEIPFCFIQDIIQLIWMRFIFLFFSVKLLPHKWNFVFYAEAMLKCSVLLLTIEAATLKIRHCAVVVQYDCPYCQENYEEGSIVDTDRTYKLKKHIILKLPPDDLFAKIKQLSVNWIGNFVAWFFAVWKEMKHFANILYLCPTHTFSDLTAFCHIMSYDKLVYRDH